MLDEKVRAMLGDKAAQDRFTKRQELLPCPKCKGEELSITGNGYNIYDPDTLGYVESVPDTYICIICENCGIVSRATDVNADGDYSDAEKLLIADWNTRAPILAPEQVKMLEEQSQWMMYYTHSADMP